MQRLEAFNWDTGGSSAKLQEPRLTIQAENMRNRNGKLDVDLTELSTTHSLGGTELSQDRPKPGNDLRTLVIPFIDAMLAPIILQREIVYGRGTSTTGRANATSRGCCTSAQRKECMQFGTNQVDFRNTTDQVLELLFVERFQRRCWDDLV